MSTTVFHTSVDPEDPVFAGHFPGMPVFPGVYVIDFVDRNVRGSLARPVALDAIERCRLRSPVLPGDELTAHATLDPAEDGLRCRATVHTGRGLAAEMRLRYRVVHRT